MTKYTQEQLIAMTNEQLDMTAGEVQGWVLGEWCEDTVWLLRGKPVGHSIYTYNPSTNKEQMVDLMCKYLIHIEADSSNWWGAYIRDKNQCAECSKDVNVYHNDPLIAVVIASILHLQENK